MKLIVNEIPPSNNQFLGNSNNFNVYRREKERWYWLIKAAGKPPQKPIEKAKVTIIYFFPDRKRRDPDNYSGKFILDPLTKEGYIVDDCFGRVELRLIGAYDKNNPRTEIEIEEAP